MLFRKQFDLWLLVPVVALLALSSFTIYSVNQDYFLRQVLFIAIGMLFFFIATLTERKILLALSNYYYLFSIILLLLPLLFGTITRGSTRWINLGFFNLQPSEVIKPLIIIFFSMFITRESKITLRRLIVGLVLVGVTAALVVIQPDLGSTLVILFSLGVMILFIGIPKKYFLGAVLVLAIFAPLGWRSLHAYQQQRLISFVNPYRDPLGSGYNVIQAKITVGSGNIFGKGFGQGTQSHLAFLPERHTDFIFASYSEEFGFIGAFVLLFFYIVLYLRIVIYYDQAGTLSTRLIIIGILSSLVFQTIVNIGMNIGLMPVTGITLPLFSYGGSSMVTTLFCLGIISNLAKTYNADPLVRIR